MSTEIANEALGRIGEYVIVDIDSDTTEIARAAKLFMESTVKSVQRAHPWNCCKARLQLAQDTTPPDFGWSYSYTLPTLCLRVVTLNGTTLDENYKEDFYEIEGRQLLTDADTAKITYIEYVEDYTKWDPLLRDAIVTLLASRLASKIGRDDTLSMELMQEYRRMALPLAQKIDANERKERPYSPVGDSKWLQARSVRWGTS